jgi:hypothetical protein
MDIRSVEAFCDGVPLQRQIQPLGDGFRLVATLQPRDRVEGTLLHFVVPSVSAPVATEDRRLLGIAFTRMILLQTDTKKAITGKKYPRTRSGRKSKR